MIVVGIVGTPAGGKSTVARRLRELGATWVHADRLAHRCLERPGVIHRLAKQFGPKIVAENGRLDRRQIAEIVFGDDERSQHALHYLESVVHPYVRHMVLRRLTRADTRGIAAGIVDAPLLLEADWGMLCDIVLCVDAPESMRVQWIKQRGWSLEELQRRERKQMSIGEKRRLATHVLTNDGTRESLIQQVDQFWEWIKVRLQCKAAPELQTPPSHCLKYKTTLPHLP